MQDEIMALGLRRAGFPSLERFMEFRGLSSPAQAREALMPWVLGYDLRRICPGDTFYALARETGVSLAAVLAANPGQDPEHLRVGDYVVVPMAFPVVPEDTPVSWTLCHYVLRGLQVRYPCLQMDTIGTSGRGRPLERLCLGAGKRIGYYNAAHHANEWITVWVVLSCLERCLQALVENQPLLGRDMGEVFRASRLYLTPLVNPDGVDLVTGAATEGEVAQARAIGERYPDIPFPAGWKADLQGVDLNLNYPAGWQEAKALKYALGYDTPAPRDFVGDCPLSQRETQAMYSSTLALCPDVVIAWHTQGEEIYWRYQQQAPAGAYALGAEMAQASGYALADSAKSASYAGYKDWVIEDLRRPGYTVEAGLGENPLPLSQLGELVEASLPIFLLGLTGGDPDFQPPEEEIPEVPEPEHPEEEDDPEEETPEGETEMCWG